MTDAPAVLRLARRFNCPRERVFDAWIDPQALVVWFHPGVETVAAELDARPGGSYRFGMRQTPGGDLVYVTGEIRELRRPEYLELTWSPSLDAAGTERCHTVVQVTFVDHGLECELQLRQEAFPSAATRDLHAQGWERCMELLRKLLRGGA